MHYSIEDKYVHALPPLITSECGATVWVDFLGELIEDALSAKVELS